MKLTITLMITFFSLKLLAQGFWDQGLISGHVRTDYNNPNDGKWLPVSYTYPSPYFPCNPSTQWMCGYDPEFFSASNAWSNGNFWATNYWVLSFNNETAYNRRNGAPRPAPLAPVSDNRTFNLGPPNQSLSRAAPGSGIMGFTILKDIPAGEYFNRAHMVMNTYFANPQPSPIPYMGLGAQFNRGNGSVPGYINGQPWDKHTVTFKEKVYAIDTPIANGHAPTMASYIVFLTQWAGKRRGLFISLYHWNIDNSSQNSIGTFRWN